MVCEMDDSVLEDLCRLHYETMAKLLVAGRHPSLNRVITWDKDADEDIKKFARETMKVVLEKINEA